jgi:tetratricopeptide (TPR) repeat protein
VHLRRGDLLALHGEWAGAQEEYERSVDADGGLIALRKLAQAQLQRRDTAGVRETIRELRRNGARSEDLLLLESIVALRTGELLEARRILDAAEDSPQKHYVLALLGIVQGDHTSAQEHLEATARGWEPVLRASARTLQGAYQEFGLFPEGQNIHLVTLLARALAQVLECELALPLLVQVTQLKEDYRDAWIVQGYCELTTDRPQQALASLEQAYQLDPQKPEIQYFLARAYAALGNPQNAITFLEYALQNGFEPQAEVRRLLAEQAREFGDAALALEQYGHLLEQERPTFDAFEGFVAVSIGLGRTDDALVRAQQAVERFPEDAVAHDLLGWALASAGQTDAARAALQRALELDPFLQSAKDRLGTLR